MSAAQPLCHSNGLAWQARAYRIWAAGIDAPHGVRTLGERTLVPVMRNSVMRNLQVIEADGRARFITPGKTRGCCHLIGRPATFVLTAAEFNTAAGLHEATGQAVAVCFSLENMPHVLRKMWCEFAIPVIAVTPVFVENIEGASRAFGGFSTDADLKPWVAAWKK